MSESRQPVLERSLAVLDCFTEGRPEWATAELAVEVGLPVSTTYRLVSTLEAQGLIRPVGGGRYRLGAAAMSLGHRASAGFDLGRDLHPPARAGGRGDARDGDPLGVRAAPAGGALHRPRGGAAAASPRRSRSAAWCPLHAGATSKAMLAFLGPDVLESVLARPLEQLAPGTITDPAALAAEIAKVREQGYAVSREETNEGAWGAAAPVLSRDGRAMAVIGMAGPLMRYDKGAEAAARDAVLTAARSSAKSLGA